MNLLPKRCQHAIERDSEHATASCAVVFDKFGDCKLIMANMDIHQTITSEMVRQTSYNSHPSLFRIIEPKIQIQITIPNIHHARLSRMSHYLPGHQWFCSMQTYRSIRWELFWKCARNTTNLVSFYTLYVVTKIWWIRGRSRKIEIRHKICRDIDLDILHCSDCVCVCLI